MKIVTLRLHTRTFERFKAMRKRHGFAGNAQCIEYLLLCADSGRSKFLTFPKDGRLRGTSIYASEEAVDRLHKFAAGMGISISAAVNVLAAAVGIDSSVPIPERLTRHNKTGPKPLKAI